MLPCPEFDVVKALGGHQFGRNCLEVLMKMFMAAVVQIMFVMFILEGDARSAEQAACKKFLIVFKENVKDLPQFIYSNEEVIGKVDGAQGQSSSVKQLLVCIDNKHAGKFEKNTACYVSKDKIFVYNVWSTGIDLKEGESINGFTSRFGLYAYEAQELFVLIRDAAMAFVAESIGKLVGEDPVVKAKKAYDVLVK